MPTYAYACKDCTHSFDIQQSFSEDSLTVCPECGGRLRKKFNSVGVVFKGSGFYRTDSRDAASTVPAAASKNDSAKADAAKPAAKAESGSGSAPATAGSAGTSA
ncbi:FmdB family transcriptional regulator [Arthrobacter zhangbolii]|uniref:FmdB family transcriptional regulator n=1 Tax=Arthrobacter zhangbolii TaxID=2886936 RepID=A0A9X1S9Z1_9MICC|nr:FmdB family zinc ribbon protein [Arthrobacter zhangbolii]MCC3272787.1 FmdB family transcriptional regulator [Arthrobacter zhangbolii]MCC3294954.1 FmdB family transcriptional regulator [Arthrobacter zhangbolii]UON91379.1 FmdB family transcriptional regulator [Arthrobacter zhangbolii]